MPGSRRPAAADPARLAGGVRLHDEAAEPLIAEALNITRAEVHGVVTFYHDFRRAPAGRHVLKLCRAEACQAAGGDPLAAHAAARLGVEMGTTAPDGSVTLEPVYCLGLCAVAPLGHAGRPADRPARPSPAGCAPCGGAAMTLRLYIPLDAAALAVGADEVATGIKAAAARRDARDRHCPHRLARALLARADGRGRDPGRPGRVRTGDAGRCGGAVRPPFSLRRAHAAARTARDIPFLAQTPDAADLRALRYRRSAARSTITARMAAARDCESASVGPDAIVEEVMQSGLRGRGGAGFPTGIKWQHGGADAPAPQKYIVCNADEGDCGTFADRMIMEGDPFVLIEGMAIAGIAAGATKGYVYIRSEYPHAVAAMEAAIVAARSGGMLGRASRAPLSASTWKCASAPAPMCAARRPRCSTVSKASAARCAPSRRCRRIRACSAARP